jgi:hypothetical protein
LNEPVCYLALAAYPAIVLLVFNWFGAGPRWARENRWLFLPPELKKKTEEQGRPLALVRYALLLLALRGLAGAGLWYTVQLATHLRTFLSYMVLGIAGGLLILAYRHLLSEFFPSAASAENNEYLLRGSAVLWLAIFFTGGFVEEFWRAVCITSFQANSYGGASADLLTAFAFSLAHLSGLPSRIGPGVISVFAEIVVGLMLGGLFIWSGNVVAPCFASVVYFSSNFFLVRKRFGPGRLTPG